LDVVELERQRHDLAAQVQTQQSQLTKEFQAHQARMQKLTEQQAADSARTVSKLQAQAQSLSEQLAELRSRVAVTEEKAILQEVRVYKYQHPLTDAPTYQAELARIHDNIK